MMKVKKTGISGLYEIDMFHASDERGGFTKSFQKSVFEENDLVSTFDESFFSSNKKGVIRGMHYQNPPHDHAKLVYAAQGKILDVILDLRKSSSTYGNYVEIEISSENHKAIYIPSGMAHGFCCLNESIMVYLTSTERNIESEGGLLWNSFGMEWPVENAIISDRDKSFSPFSKFKSPFK